MTTKPVQVDLWKLIAGLMGSGAFGGGVTMAAMQTTMAVAESRIERNTADIRDIREEIQNGLRQLNEQINRLQVNNVALIQSIAKLEAISK